MKTIILLLFSFPCFSQNSITVDMGGSGGGSSFTPVAGQNITISGSTFNASPHYIGNNKFQADKEAILRATSSGANSPIVWTFVDTTEGHNVIGLDSVSGSGNGINIYFPTVKYISSFNVYPENGRAAMGIVVGSSIGLNLATAYAYYPRIIAGRLTGNTTTWTNTGITLSGLTYSTSTGLTQFSPTTGAATVYNGSSEIAGTIIQYVGTAHKRVVMAYSGLSQQVGFFLADSTNTLVTGNLAATDIVTVVVPRVQMVAIPAGVTGSNGFPADIYNGEGAYLVQAKVELWMITQPLTTTSIKIEWQAFTSATNYRITRAPMSSPNSETTIYSGTGFTVTDTGLTTRTQYKYRMYKTVSAVETLLTNDKCTTL